MSDVAIRVENLSKRYRIGRARPRHDTLRDALAAACQRFRVRTVQRANAETLWALKDVSFEVAHGEVVGIIGRNGAGKTTLLKILSRITEPTSGRAILHGRVGSLLEVGTGFHPELTGRENIYLSGAILGMRKAEIARQFDQIVAFAEIEKFLDTPVKRYSSGMYVRLAFAVAAHLDPEILLVDEVLAVGDAAFQKKCLGKMGEVAGEGRTVLFVSHNMVAVQRLCKRAIWLEEGEVAGEGLVHRLVASYLRVQKQDLLEQVWDDWSKAPGTDAVRLRRVSVEPLGQAPGQPITVKTPLRLEVEFWNRTPGAALNLSIHFHTSEGVPVFALASEAAPRPRGLVRGAFQIPPDFLNDGTYCIMVMIVLDRSVALYSHSEAIVFDVQDAGRSDRWYGKWPGVVRPQFEFPVTSVEGPI